MASVRPGLGPWAAARVAPGVGLHQHPHPSLEICSFHRPCGSFWCPGGCECHHLRPPVGLQLCPSQTLLQVAQAAVREEEVGRP